MESFVTTAARGLERLLLAGTLALTALPSAAFPSTASPGAVPATVANFLRYIDASRYDGGRFHRAVRLDNQVRDDVLIEVIQAGGNPLFRRQQFAPISLERTRDTGLLQVDGTLSMAGAQMRIRRARISSFASAINRHSTTMACAAPTVRALRPSAESCAAWTWCGRFSNHRRATVRA